MDKNNIDENQFEKLLSQMEQVPIDYEPDARYLEINEFSNALDFLEKAHMFLSNYDDPYRWKWVSSSLISSLSGLMICALRGSNYEKVIDFSKMDKDSMDRIKELSKNYSTKNYLECCEIRNNFLDSQNAKLISFHEAFKRIQKEQYMMEFCHSSAIEISQSEQSSIFELKKTFRNQFEHYRPLSWVIEQQIFIPLVRDTMSVINKLLNNFNITTHHSSNRLSIAKLHCVWIDRLITENEIKLSKIGQ